MIQVNLLPDVKQEYLKAQQTKHTVLVGAVLVSIVVSAFTVLFFAYVQIVQPQYQKRVQGDIDSGIQEIKKKPNAQRIVTVQGVLEQIPALKDKQVATSRIFDYLTQFTPRVVTYNKVTLNLETNNLTISGSTVSYEKANELANNLKSAQFSYTKADVEQKTQPFTGVVFNSLGKSESATDGRPVSFEITFTFDPVMFDPSITNNSIKVNASSEELLLPDSKPFKELTPGAQQ